MAFSVVVVVVVVVFFFSVVSSVGKGSRNLLFSAALSERNFAVFHRRSN